ncbi:MAG TPA: phosphoribosyltransferase [Cyanobacteria bacterium UBA8543]|nr:phosphoribosyltransferase [Cyanobacteria bacterium UBA8543]
MSSGPLFSDRADAGEQLAQSLLTQVSQLEEAGITALPIVYALPRGGIPIAAPVAQKLGCPLDIVVAKKIATPQNPELAIGAVTSEGQVLWARQKLFSKKNSTLLETAQRQAQEKAQAQLEQLSSGRPNVNPEGALALLVDDGIATGMTMAAATQALKAHNPAQIWICAPVAPAGLIKWLSRWCDRLVILETPEPFWSVSRFYADFPQVETKEALVYLQQHNHPLTKEEGVKG